MATTVYRLIYL